MTRAPLRRLGWLVLAVALASLLWLHHARALELNPETDRISRPGDLPDGRKVVMGIYYVPAIRTYFAGCLVSLPGRPNDYEIMPAFARWNADVPTDFVEKSQTLMGAIAKEGGLAKFIVRLAAYMDECYMDLSGFTRDNSPSLVTTRELLAAAAQWHLKATDWPLLMLFWPENQI